MAINHGPLDITLDKRDDRQLETEEAMIDVATSHGQESKGWKHRCPPSCHMPNCLSNSIKRRTVHMHDISGSFHALVTHDYVL
jgi:hypothetical protein